MKQLIEKMLVFLFQFINSIQTKLKLQLYFAELHRFFRIYMEK